MGKVHAEQMVTIEVNGVAGCAGHRCMIRSRMEKRRSDIRQLPITATS